MSGFYTEADYESTIIELFENMGWRHVYGPDLDRDYRDPLYEEVLDDAIRRINPDMPESAIREAIFKLKNFDNADIVHKNGVLMDYIQHGVEVRYLVGSARGWSIWLITRILTTTPLLLPTSGPSLKTATSARMSSSS